MKGECPSCFAEIDTEKHYLGTIMVGLLIPCPDCGVDLEIREIKDDTIILTIAEEIQEDWGE